MEVTCTRTNLVDHHRLLLFGPSHRINSFLHLNPWTCERPSLSLRASKQKNYQFSLARSPMHNTCTNYLRQHTRWSSQLGATQDGAVLLRDHKNFHWRQYLYFLHLRHQLNWSEPRQLNFLPGEHGLVHVHTEKINSKAGSTRGPLTSPHSTGQRSQSPCRPCWINNLSPVWVSTIPIIK